MLAGLAEQSRRGLTWSVSRGEPSNEPLQRTSSSATLSNSPLNALCVGRTTSGPWRYPISVFAYTRHSFTSACAHARSVGSARRSLQSAASNLSSLMRCAGIERETTLRMVVLVLTRVGFVERSPVTANSQSSGTRYGTSCLGLWSITARRTNTFRRHNFCARWRAERTQMVSQRRARRKVAVQRAVATDEFERYALELAAERPVR